MNNFLEKTLEDIIFENRDVIASRGLDVFYKNSARQLRLPTGRIIDIFTWEITEENVIKARIIELKREVVSKEALFQICEYFSDLTMELLGSYADYEMELVLIGTSVDNDIYDIIATSEIIRLFIYNYDYDGIRFNDNNFRYSEQKKMFTNYDRPIRNEAFGNQFRKYLQESN